MIDTPETPPKQRRWLMPVLFVSLAANLLVVGVLAGAMLSPDGPRHERQDRQARGLVGEPFIRALPREDRRALVGEAMRNRERIRESREALRERFGAFLEVLRTDPFDAEEAARLFSAQRQAAVRRQEIGETLLMNRLQEMTPEERAAYADALEQQLNAFRKKR
ncbi:MAG: periplasmic heavy metal sensor [Pseudomonadota bacterium]